MAQRAIEMRNLVSVFDHGQSPRANAWRQTAPVADQNVAYLHAPDRPAAANGGSWADF